MDNDRIIKWKKEIGQILEQQRDYDRKCAERIRVIKKKIAEEEKRLKVENNELIANAVRKILGDVTPENVALFKEKIQLISELEDENDERPQDNNTTYTG